MYGHQDPLQEQTLQLKNSLADHTVGTPILKCILMTTL